jgi:hypothetical protein
LFLSTYVGFEGRAYPYVWEGKCNFRQKGNGESTYHVC